MKSLKHIGRISNTGAKILVVFRTLPGDSGSALVLPVANLNDSYHDALIQLVETDQAQGSFEFGEIMHIRHFPDGRPMLVAMSQDNRLQKVPTSSVIMTPTHDTTIVLSELNALIAEQKNCTIDDLASLVQGSPTKVRDTSAQAEAKNIDVQETQAALTDTAVADSNAVLSDEDLAKSYRSQADALYKEAARLRREAEVLDPIQKKTISKVKETDSA
jgi:hypothetical protein